MMVLGYGLKMVGIFNEGFVAQLNNLCFKVFLPMVLFSSIYHSDFYSDFSPKLIAYGMMAILTAFGLLMLIVPHFEKQQINCPIIVQGIYRSNFVLFGIPVAAALYGDKNAGATAILLAFIVPLYNFLAIIALEQFSEHKGSKLKVLKEIVKNPLIIGAMSAFFLVICRIELPTLVEDAIFDIASVATPLALMVLGGSFKFSNLRKYLPQLTITVLGKLVLMPVIFLGIAILLGFRGPELAALLSMLAAPTAVSTYTMAHNYGANEELASQIIVVDSLLAVVTIFALVSGLQIMGML